jgi:DNA-binding IscR family transcriptional regulator
MDCFSHPEGCHEACQCSIMSVLRTAQDALVNCLRNTNLRLMVQAKSDPFHSLPPKHFLKPQFGCPVLK